MAGSSTVVDLLIRARDAASGVIGRVGDAVGGLADQARAALEPLRSFTGLIGAAIGIGGAKEIIDRADAFTGLSNQLRVAAKGEEDYRASLAAVTEIAKDANSDLDGTARLYGKVKQNADALGISQQQIADVTATVAKGMQLSGAETAAANGATIQFTQALASGVLRGDEFNSVMEASPALIKAIADGLGVAVGDMRAMAEAGQLTSDRVVQALLSQKSAIDDVYGKLPQTVGQALGQLDNAATLFVGRLNEQTGATRTLGDGLKFLASNMDAVAAVMGAAFAASTARAAQSTAQFVAASIAARDASRQQALAAEQQQAANLAAAQGQVAAAQAAYNRALAEQRATAAQLAALESLAGLFASEEALAVARGQASAAANAATAATQRYAAAQAALNALQAPAAASAGLFSRALGFLAGPGGLILTAVASFGLLYSAFSKQKPVTDELSQSTEQYAESLKKLNQAQLDAAFVKLGDAIRDQRQAAAEAAAEVERLRSGHVGLWEALTESKSRAQLLTEAEGAQADATAKLNDLEAKREALLRQSADAKQQAAASDMATVTAYNQQVAALDKLAGQLGDREKYLKQVNDAEIAQTQALLDKAKALGDEAEAERLSIQLAGQRAKAAEQAAALARAEAVAEDTKVAALEKVRDLQGKLTPQQQQSLALARESAAAKNAEAGAAELLADKLKTEADSQRDGIAAKERAAKKTNEIATASSGYVSALEAVANAQLSGLRSEIDLATAKGYTWEAQRKSVELAKLEAQWAQAIAAAKQLEIAAEQASVQAKIAELQGRSDNSQAIQLEISALQLKSQALGMEAQAAQTAAQAKTIAAQQAAAGNKLQADTQKEVTKELKLGEVTTDGYTKTQEGFVKHTNDGSAALKGLSDYLGIARQQVDNLSESSRAYFEQELFQALSRQGFQGAFESALRATIAYSAGVNESRATLGKFAAELNNANLLIDQSEEKLLFSGNGFRTWEAAIELATGKAKKAFYEQAIAAENLRARIAEMTESGAIDTNSLAVAAQAAANDFNRLDEQDLSGLRGALDDANAKLREMQAEAQSAQDRIAELNAEIAAEKGDTATADKLKLQLEQQQALADVEAKLAEARRAQNRELIALYEEQKRKLQELYDLKERNLEQDQRQQNQQTPTGGSGTSPATGSGAATPAQASRLDLAGVGGKTLTATTEADPGAFLDALEAAKNRSLA